jgi:hypothetical protein
MSFENVTQSRKEVKKVVMNSKQGNLIEVKKVSKVTGTEKEFLGAYSVERVDKGEFSDEGEDRKDSELIELIKKLPNRITEKFGINQANGLKVRKKDTSEIYYIWASAGAPDNVYIAKDIEEFKNNPDKFAHVDELGYPTNLI